MDKIQPLITSIPEKLDAINEVLVKGSSISYFNAIGLGRKSGDVCSTINKIVAQYEVCSTSSHHSPTTLLPPP